MTSVEKGLTAAAAVVVVIIIGLVVAILRQGGGDDEVASAGPTTTPAPPPTTAPPDAPTTSVPPDGTTTTAAPTTTSSTTSTSTTTSSTTTTLPPEAIERVFSLSIDEAAFDSRVTNDGRVGFDGDDLLVVRADSSGFDPGSRATGFLRWTIPATELTPLGDAPQVSVLLDPVWSVELDTGPNRGRSARADLELSGSFGGQPIGQGTDLRSIGAGDRLDVRSTDPIGFGAPAPAGGGSLIVELALTCTAQPGETVFQIGEESACSTVLAGDVRATVRRADG